MERYIIASRSEVLEWNLIQDEDPGEQFVVEQDGEGPISAFEFEPTAVVEELNRLDQAVGELEDERDQLEDMQSIYDQIEPTRKRKSYEDDWD